MVQQQGSVGVSEGKQDLQGCENLSGLTRPQVTMQPCQHLLRSPSAHGNCGKSCLPPGMRAASGLES